MPGRRRALVRITQSLTAGCPDYSTSRARRVVLEVLCISPRIPDRVHRRAMFTVKPANDTKEFYEAIRGQATVRARAALPTFLSDRGSD